MTTKRDDPLKLDMDPEEAFERFLGVLPEELPEHVLKREGKTPRTARGQVAIRPVRAGGDIAGEDAPGERP
jgi:hypothetical protein